MNLLQDENGNTPLHYAFMFGNDENSDVVDALIRLGANPTAKNNKEKMPNEMKKASKYEIRDLMDLIMNTDTKVGDMCFDSLKCMQSFLYWK